MAFAVDYGANLIYIDKNESQIQHRCFSWVVSMNLKKWFVLATMAFALAACGDDSSTGGGSGNGDNPENPESSGSQDPSNLSSSIEWILPNDPSKLWTGEGTEANPYELKNEEDILTLANEVNNQAVNFNGVAFKLTADVSLSKNWTPIGCVKGQSNRTFGGIFDGGDHTIKGLSIDDTASFSGLFGYISGAKIKNVKVDGASIKAGSYVGILFGKAENAEIANVSVSGTLQGADFVGGLGGSISKGNVETASVSGTVSGTGTVGGVIATAISSTIKSANNGAAVTGKTTVAGCVATLSMKSSVELCVNKGNIAGTQDVAGIVAKASEATVKQSGNEGAITGEDNNMSSVGGVVAVGSNSAVLEQVYNVGAVTAKTAIGVGGIAGKFVTDASMKNAFNQGQITAEGSTNVGGLVGKAETCKITAAYNAGVVSPIANAGSVAGAHLSTSETTSVYYDAATKVAPVAELGEASEAMKTADFLALLNADEDVWAMDGGKYAGFPFFTWMN